MGCPDWSKTSLPFNDPIRDGDFGNRKLVGYHLGDLVVAIVFSDPARFISSAFLLYFVGLWSRTYLFIHPVRESSIILSYVMVYRQSRTILPSVCLSLNRLE